MVVHGSKVAARALLDELTGNYRKPMANMRILGSVRSVTLISLYCTPNARKVSYENCGMHCGGWP